MRAFDRLSRGAPRLPIGFFPPDRGLFFGGFNLFSAGVGGGGVMLMGLRSSTVFGSSKSARQFQFGCGFLAIAGLCFVCGEGNPAPAPFQDAASTKTTLRIDAGPADKLDLVYAPQEIAALESFSTFKPSRGWRAPAPAPIVAVGPTNKPIVRPKALALVLPPPRPNFRAKPVKTRLALAKESAQAKNEHAGGGFNLSFLVPNGATIWRKIGSVGDSIGKIVHLSSR